MYFFCFWSLCFQCVVPLFLIFHILRFSHLDSHESFVWFNFLRHQLVQFGLSDTVQPVYFCLFCVFKIILHLQSVKASEEHYLVFTLCVYTVFAWSFFANIADQLITSECIWRLPVFCIFIFVSLRIIAHVAKSCESIMVVDSTAQKHGVLDMPLLAVHLVWQKKKITKPWMNWRWLCLPL